MLVHSYIAHVGMVISGGCSGPGGDPEGRCVLWPEGRYVLRAVATPLSEVLL